MDLRLQMIQNVFAPAFSGGLSIRLLDYAKLAPLTAFLVTVMVFACPAAPPIIEYGIQ